MGSHYIQNTLHEHRGVRASLRAPLTAVRTATAHRPQPHTTGAQGHAAPHRGMPQPSTECPPCPKQAPGRSMTLDSTPQERSAPNGGSSHSSADGRGAGTHRSSYAPRALTMPCRSLPPFGRAEPLPPSAHSAAGNGREVVGAGRGWPSDRRPIYCHCVEAAPQSSPAAMPGWTGAAAPHSPPMPG